jgi:TolB-like protein
MSRLKRLIHEIHRRSLWQVLGIYVVGGWIAFQVAQTLTEGLGLPDWFPGLALGLLIVLLPVVLATAFVQEAVGGQRDAEETPPGTAAEPAVEEARGAGRRSFTWRNAGLAFVIALGVWGVVATGWLLIADRAEPEGMGAAEEILKSVAVLPFENVSPDPENEYFADGMHEEIILQLFKVADLHVISRTSVMEYKGRSGNLRAIADSLGVTNILEGTVRLADGRVRITTQLIDALADKHLWAETYDRDLSDVFAVQSDVAQQVAAAVGAELTTAERGQIEKVPTENPEAYDYYLRGTEYTGRAGLALEDWRYAQQMLQRAVVLDPRFALAHARLSYLHAQAYEYGVDRSEERLRRAREAADRALEIDPDLSSGHLALGIYYHAVRDLDSALEEIAIAQRGLPGSGYVLSRRGLILKRQGKWDEALASQERALALSPREPYRLYDLGVTYTSLRRYEEAESYLDRAVALQPDFVEAAMVRAAVSVYGRGDTGPFRSFVEGIPWGFDPRGVVTVLRAYADYLDRDYAAALEVLSRSELEYFEFPGPGGSVQGASAPRTLLMGLCYAALGETDRARAAADSARRDLEARLGERPDDPRLHGSLSQAHAVLGQREEAIRAAQRAVELLPIAKDAIAGPDYVSNLAATYAWFGEVDAAVEEFELYLSVPAEGSIDYILLDPAIDPIRDHPRFQAFVERHR